MHTSQRSPCVVGMACMRLALLLKHTRSLFHSRSSHALRIMSLCQTRGMKRTHSLSATAVAQAPRKILKVADSFSEASADPTHVTGSHAPHFVCRIPPPRVPGKSLASRSSCAHSSSNLPKVGTTAARSYATSARSSRKSRRRHGAAWPGLPVLDPPLHDEAYITSQSEAELAHLPPLKPTQLASAKSMIFNLFPPEERPEVEVIQGTMDVDGMTRTMHRCTLKLPRFDVVGVGDSRQRKEAEHLAFLSALYQLHVQGILEKSYSATAKSRSIVEEVVTLSDNSVVDLEKASSFMDYYCRRYRYPSPDITYKEVPCHGGLHWEAVMLVGDRKIGFGVGSNKRHAKVTCYLDATRYLEDCDPNLWKSFVDAVKHGTELGLGPKVLFKMSYDLEDDLKDMCHGIRSSILYKNYVALGSSRTAHGSQRISLSAPASTGGRTTASHSEVLRSKSARLSEARNAYLRDPQNEPLRQTRMALPVYSSSADVVRTIKENDVVILMASTGSGKTTQVPQLILDDYISKGRGSMCNVVCTQPRRIAAISVADRIAKERGEVVGRDTVGYQVRFEAKLPEPHGSITFCTVGIFLRWMQLALTNSSGGPKNLEDVTHIIVDEVHERDVDTDLLLVVLRQFLADRKARGKPIKLILMSATIDPSLFQQYFRDDKGVSAPVIEVPGRSYPVTKYHIEDYLTILRAAPEARWAFSHESTMKYLTTEIPRDLLVNNGLTPIQLSSGKEGDYELPFAFIALVISHVIRNSTSGHILVFLPGWDEIMGINQCLNDHSSPFGRIFADENRYHIHFLHSTIPLAEQQAIFAPPPKGVRRIILATNIAESSVTIPDVVYVVDTARVKEMRYDPERRMSSLVSAWVGSSNLTQRAGRAGRHRPGEYWGILGKKRALELEPYQTVEMKRVDLSNVVMHVKALDFPGMSVQDVLAAAIEPPQHDRVVAAMKDLCMVGALDENNSLTPLGRVLLQLPVDVQMGRLVVLGSFFRCLDNALTLAAILSNRIPFLAPLHLRTEAAAKKAAFATPEFRSDALAVLKAYNQWARMQENGEFLAANRFCVENFLSKPTLLLIQKIRQHLLQSLYNAGIIAVSGGGQIRLSGNSKNLKVPRELNSNSDSMPLLVALVATASQPNFAVRISERSYRTSRDKMTFIHPSSVNSHKQGMADDLTFTRERQIYAFAEKRQNLSTENVSPQISLVTTTKVDPLTYMLFGAHKIKVADRGLECDGWLPVVGNMDTLAYVQRLKKLMEGCMSRVFEGITMSRNRLRPFHNKPDERDFELDDDVFDALDRSERGRKDLSLSAAEIQDLDLMTRDIARILNQYNEERIDYLPTQQPELNPPLRANSHSHLFMHMDSSASRGRHSATIRG